MSPQPPLTSRSFCCSPQVSCVSGTPDQISDDEVLIPRLHGTFLPRLPTVMTMFSFRVSHTVLFCFCVMVMLRFPFRAPVFLAFPPPPPLLLFALNLPCRLAAVVMPSRVWLIPICFFFFLDEPSFPLDWGALLSPNFALKCCY
jgi:hypothetical protein